MYIFDNRSKKEKEEAAKWQMDIFDRAYTSQKNTEEFVKNMQEMYKRNTTVYNNRLYAERLQEQLERLTKGTGKKLPEILSEAIENFLPDDDQIQELGLAMGESLGYEGNDLAIFVAAYQTGAKEIMQGLTW